MTVPHRTFTGDDLHVPKTHASSHTDGSDDIQLATAAQKGLMSAAYAAAVDGLGDCATLDVGTTAGTVCAGDDSRLSGGAHAASHTDGTDDIQTATSGQKGLMSAAYAAAIDGLGDCATLDVGTTAGTVCAGDDSRLSGSLTIASIHGLAVSVNDTDKIAIDTGSIDISGTPYSNATQIVKTLSGLSSSTIYHIYVAPPASGINLSATDISASTTAPTYNVDKGAGYLGTGRWLGWLETDGSGNISVVESVQQFNAIAVAGIETYLVRETAPFGRIECDGSAISRTTYAALFTGHPGSIGTAFGVGDGSTTFALPDLRGRFLRTWANGSSNDPDRASRTNRGDGTTGDHPGTLQSDEFKSHYHQSGVDHGSTGDDYGVVDNGLANSSNYWITASTGGNETRPANMGVSVFVKYIGGL